MASEVLQAKELKQKWAQHLATLEEAFREGLSGTALTQQLTQRMDELVRQAYRQALRQVTGAVRTPVDSLALVALGGYGRRQLCVWSDVDLMFLYRGRRSAQIEDVIKTTFHQLWDMGLEVGHAVRTPKDALAVAQQDNVSLTSMFESRYLAGSRDLHEVLKQSLSRFVQQRGRARFIRAKIDERLQRIERFGDTVCIQAPHLKEGIGALRDFHHGIWIAHLLLGVWDIGALQRLRVVGPTEAALLKEAVDCVLRLRNGLHFLTGKREDVLTFARQEALAKSLSFQDAPDDLAEAAMLRLYYGRALQLKRFAESMTRKAMAQLATRSTVAFSWKRQENMVGLDPLFVVEHGEITFRQYQPRPERLRDFFAEDPLRLLSLVELLQEHPLAWSTPVCLALEASRDLIDEAFLQRPEVSAKLLQLFHQPKGLARVLVAMRDSRLLCRFFPELSKIRFLVRHDFYHRYTVDEHSIRAVEALERLGALPARSDVPEQFSEEALAALARRCPRPEVLCLAVLFHDAGKGYGRGHSERGTRLVDPVLERLGLSPEERATVRFLIRNHLLLSETAFRRDLDDFKTIEEFTGKVGDLERLEYLLVLTYVDIASASPGAMTPWKAGLLWQLYLHGRQLLLGQPALMAQDVEKSRQNILDVLAAHYTKELILDQLEQLPHQYTLYSSLGLIGRHLAALQRYDGKRPQVNIRFLDLHETELAEETPVRQEAIEVILCTQDRLGLFRDIARSFHLENFHIRSARLFTRKDGTVVDTITAVNATPASPIGAIRQQLLGERLERLVAPGTSPSGYEIHPLPEQRELSAVDLGRSYFRTNLDFLNDVSDDYSLVEVRAMDHPALLETLAGCLTAKGIDIRFARLQKQGGRVVLAFYVTDSQGAKITDTSRQREIRDFVLHHLDPKTHREDS